MSTIEKWVREEILNGTSAQLGYTAPFTSVCAGKYRTEEDRRQIKNDNTKTKRNTEKPNNAKHSKTKLHWFSCFLRYSARKYYCTMLPS